MVFRALLLLSLSGCFYTTQFPGADAGVLVGPPDVARIDSGYPPPCNPQNCAGCCSADQRCLTGIEDQACGSKGAACTACSAKDRCEAGSCRQARKRVFLTSTGYTGDLKTAGGASNALEAADNLCMLAAEAVLLKGTFVAWISTSAADAIDRVGSGPWYNDCTNVAGIGLVANNKAGLLTTLSRSIRCDEHGVDHGSGGGGLVWTGTGANGKVTSASCKNWTDGSFNSSGTAGDFTLTSERWTDYGQVYDCRGKYPLYCFEL